MNRRLFFSGAAAVAAIAAGGYAYRSRSIEEQADAEKASLNSPTADPIATLRSLALPDLDGKPYRLDQWQGRPLVINFWATWCAPCVKEMPELQALHEKYPNIQFVGIGVDKVENMQKFLQKVPVSYPLLVMEAGAIAMLRQLGNSAGGLPFTLVLQANGDVNSKILGQFKFDDLDSTLSGLAA